MKKDVNFQEEAIECVKYSVLPMHKQIYDKCKGNFDRIYKCGIRSCPEQCECSRQSILYILSQLEPNSKFDVLIVNTILRGSDRCTFRITRQ